MDKAKLRELEEHGHYYSVPRGVSMHPMLKNGESIVDIVPFQGKLKKYDSALFYRKEEHKYVLHRILDVKKTHYVFYGDNCWTKEIVQFDDVIGVVSQFKRDAKSKWISVNDKRYLFYVHLWCDMLHARRLLLWMKNKIKTKVEKSAKIKAGYDMLYLIACEINNIKPQLSSLDKLNLQNLYDMSKFHNLTNIVFTALENAYGKNLPENKVISTWREEKNKAIRKNILLDAERTELFSWCEKNGIWYVPLKGILLKDLYPKTGMREMADNDILFDTEYSEQLKDWFVTRGYEYLERSETDEHDTYTKSPIYQFEMHPTLIPNGDNPELAAHYVNIKDKLICDKDKQYGCHLSDDDFYIYITAHTYKHYKRGGTGVRSLLDCYVFCNAKKDLNYTYIEKELDKLGILEFEQTIRQLAQKIFSSSLNFEKNLLSSEENEILEYILLSGTYGCKEQRIRTCIVDRFNKISKNKGSKYLKLRYIFNKLFPERETMEKWCNVHAPVFINHRWLMPLSAVYRILMKDVTRFDWLAEITAVLSTKTK